MELRETVRRTREYIEEHGWCKGGPFYDDDDGAVCIWGAYGVVSSIAFEILPELADTNSVLAEDHPCWVGAQEFRRVVSENLPASCVEGMDPIVAFNDNPETTVEDVLLHLKRVEGTL